jgi:hypothetical protein
MPAWESEQHFTQRTSIRHLPPASHETHSAMELYLFVWGTLAWTIAIAALWPLNIPLAWLAYRIWHGNKPIDEEMQDELWRRSSYGAAAIAAAAWSVLVLDYVLASWAELPAGLVHMVLLLSLLSFAAWLMMLFFAMEDFFSGLNILMIYLYLPVFVLWVPDRLLFGASGPNPLVNWFLSWLAKPHG